MGAIWKNLTDGSLWDQFLISANQANFLASFEFGKFHQLLGNKIWYLGREENSNLVGLALVLKIKSRTGSFLYCPGSPLIADWTNFGSLKEELVEIAKSEGASFIRLDPRVLNSHQLQILKQAGFRSAAVYTQPQCTLTLDLTKSLAEIRSGFSDSTRYNIGWVERKGVTVSTSERLEDLGIFLKLLKETAERQSFSLHGQADYYEKQFSAFLENKHAKLFFTWEPKDLGNDVLAASIVLYFGKTATYLHAASSSKNPKLRAPYLMQWKIIEDAKNQGFEIYDFWGIAPTGNPADKWAGVTGFKKGFGGEKICYQKPFDLVISPSYYLTNLVEKGRSWLRKVA